MPCRQPAAPPGSFRPYRLEQIHATLIGLEHIDGQPGWNRSYDRLRGEKRRMDIIGYTKAVAHHPDLPLRIRFGGTAAHETPFTPPWRRTLRALFWYLW